jgi:hypothetical protein
MVTIPIRTRLQPDGTANTREFARIDGLRWEDWEAVANTFGPDLKVL